LITLKARCFDPLIFLTEKLPSVSQTAPIAIPNDVKAVVSEFIKYLIRKIMQPSSSRHENHCIKADASRCCRTSQIPLFYRPGGVASSFSMPLYRPLSNVALLPFLLLPCLACLFLSTDGCPYFSLYPLRTPSPSRLEAVLPFSPTFIPCPAIFPFFSLHFLLSLLVFSLLSFSSFPVRQFHLL